jgi:cytochrome c biogenesis protein CcmG/thiol:disulfide interchange protein DsbE
VNHRGLIAAGAIVLGTVLMLSLAWGMQHAATKRPVLGSMAPQLAIQTSGGEQVRVSELRGKPVVLNFWASWCGPCVQELPVLSSAYSSHPNVAFVGANVQDTTSGERAFEQQHPHPYPVGPVVSGDYKSYGVIGLPVTFFVDAGGLVTASFSGPLDAQTLDHYLGLIAS